MTMTEKLSFQKRAICNSIDKIEKFIKNKHKNTPLHFSIVASSTFYNAEKAYDGNDYQLAEEGEFLCYSKIKTEIREIEIALTLEYSKNYPNNFVDSKKEQLDDHGIYYIYLLIEKSAWD